MVVHFLICPTDGDHGILQDFKGQQSRQKYQLHSGECVAGSVPAWVKYRRNTSAPSESEISAINVLFKCFLFLLMIDCWKFLLNFNMKYTLFILQTATWISPPLWGLSDYSFLSTLRPPRYFSLQLAYCENNLLTRDKVDRCLREGLICWPCLRPCLELVITPITCELPEGRKQVPFYHKTLASSQKPERKGGRRKRRYSISS